MLATDANLQDNDINFFSQKQMERHQREELKVGRHVFVVFLVFLVQSKKNYQTFIRKATTNQKKKLLISTSNSNSLYFYRAIDKLSKNISQTIPWTLVFRLSEFVP